MDLPNRVGTVEKRKPIKVRNFSLRHRLKALWDQRRLAYAAVMLLWTHTFDFALVGYTMNGNTDLVGRKCIGFRLVRKSYPVGIEDVNIKLGSWYLLEHGSKDLWNHCNKHGTVADVYITRKLLKRWLAHTNPKHSYVNVLNGNGPTNLASHPKNILKSVTLDESDLIDTSGIRNVLLAKVRDVNLIPNINIVLNKEGFYNFQCKYIGGMWLWIEFDTYEACLKLQSNKEMSWYFTLLKHLHHSFVLDERVAWIEIGGLPLNAWTPKAFKKIADSWGTPLFVDDDPKETVSTGRVCIKTKIHGQVNDYCKVVVLGKSYNVYVKEFAGWAPDIKATDSISCSNSEMGNSDKHEDNLNDNDLLDKEEGEIPNNNVNEEEEYVKNTQWTDRDTNSGKEQDNFPTEHLHSPKDKIEAQKEDSNSISKPPGFEAYNSNGKPFSSDGNHQSSKQPSHFSSAPVKSSRISKSQNKSFGNHGSMIEAFVSHIEMGKVLGYDMEGANKCKAIAKLCNKHKVSFLGIQETHSINLDPFKVKCIWGNFQFDYVERPANGRSGGIVSIWDPNAFSKINEFHYENFLVVEGNWIASHIHCYMINVYAPQDDGKKETLWNEITEFMNVNRGHHLIFGDFNVVRYASERLGTVFNHASANVFNQFIRDAQLWDIPLGGHLFTRINKHGDKLSKLDRFLTSDSFAPLLQKFSGQVLDCHISDHRPILLSPVSVDFGPTPFKFYNSWLLDKNLHSTISDFWENFAPTNCANPIISFKNKMKALKIVIKDWSLNRKDSQNREKEDLNKKIKDFDASIATRYADLSVDAQRSSWIDSLRAIELKENMDFSQKAKIKWGIEADENSKFFHAIVNQKRRYLSIQGIKIEGHWIEDPLGIKDAFLTFYEHKFQKVEVVKIVNRSPFYKTLNIDQNTYLASSISEAEIRDAIWDFGSDKSPGPDGFTFAFYKDFWNVIKSDVMDFVHHFF
ncbi:RNA-directed DNA polymerase, eukaryota [Tanacetum coccineum]|uniref:RNA-directed DNA polymerase, eukaryota n=1 Tax=Tanacetum coccineum TaxID=301880 RepID=A0ABQ5A7W7_9ASTR